MQYCFRRSALPVLLAALTLPASALSAQGEDQPNPNIIVNGSLAKGPEIKGVITARSGDKLKLATPDGASTIVAVTEATKITGAGGQTAQALPNGLPVTIKTLQSDGGLIASRISFRKGDLKTAVMIRNATAQKFEEQTAATEALRGRMGDIDKYNVKATTNVHFDTGRTELSEADKAQLCNTASSAGSTDNALLLVVGYTDSVGSDDYNQVLSEKRANRVINYLQQACGWKPYRMLTPTGMAKADPLAPNDTPEGKAQNRRVAVNVLVSKSVDGL